MIFFVLAFCGVVIGICMISFGSFSDHPARTEIAVIGAGVAVMSSLVMCRLVVHLSPGG